MKLSDFTGGSPSPDDAAKPRKLSDFGGAGAAAPGGGIWYNDAGQAIDSATGKPVASKDEGYTGSILPFRRDDAGLHLAVPEAIAAPVKGMVEGGIRASGEGEGARDPLRPLSPNTLGAVGALVGSPVAGMADRGMLGASTLEAGGRLAPKVATAPPPASGITQDRALLAKEARDTFKIQITAPQIGVSPAMKIGDSVIRKLPLSGARGEELRLQQSWNSAVAKTFGEDAKSITPTVMSRAKKRIGGEINRIENTNVVGVDGPLIDRLAEIEQSAHGSLTDQEFAVVKRQIEGVLRNVMPGDKLEGTTYGNLLHRNSPLDQ